MEKELPIFKDPEYGIEFIVDTSKLELYEKSDPSNRLGLADMEDLDEEGYQFYYYDKVGHRGFCIEVPQFVTLDPEGMARKYNKSVEEVILSTDFELMVDPELLTRRLKNGELPTVEIDGQIFYPEARIDFLRPKDDFSTLGSTFDELDYFYSEDKNVYEFPYDPSTRKIAERDWDKMIEYPNDLLFVSIPHIRAMDPIGWNRKWDFPDTFGLKVLGLKMEFKAEIIPWNKVGIDDVIAKNRLQQRNDKIPKVKDKGEKKGRGPKI